MAKRNELAQDLQKENLSDSKQPDTGTLSIAERGDFVNHTVAMLEFLKEASEAMFCYLGTGESAYIPDAAFGYDLIFDSVTARVRKMVLPEDFELEVSE